MYQKDMRCIVLWPMTSLVPTSNTKKGIKHVIWLLWFKSNDLNVRNEIRNSENMENICNDRFYFLRDPSSQITRPSWAKDSLRMVKCMIWCFALWTSPSPKNGGGKELGNEKKQEQCLDTHFLNPTISYFWRQGCVRSQLENGTLSFPLCPSRRLRMCNRESSWLCQEISQAVCRQPCILATVHFASQEGDSEEEKFLLPRKYTKSRWVTVLI